ncbi:MAG: S1 RNA-binding domain-containing protein, partial [Prevotella sp.]|nr:S1 RNA-binding domain-containing protein [Prevotella sp.]
IKYKMVEFMGEHVGETYDAHISGITSYGIYCEIDENHCEGMVPMRDLDDDYYDFDERNFRLVGRRRHSIYSLGDPIRIQVAKANLEKKQLDFTIAGRQQQPNQNDHSAAPQNNGRPHADRSSGRRKKSSGRRK